MSATIEEYQSEVKRLEHILLHHCDGWRCDACERVFGDDETNYGRDCDLCENCAREACREAGVPFPGDR